MDTFKAICYGTNYYWRSKKKGFELNPYEPCIASKMIDGEQCTTVWYVNDIKITHKNKGVVELVFSMIKKSRAQIQN